MITLPDVKTKYGIAGRVQFNSVEQMVSKIMASTAFKKSRRNDNDYSDFYGLGTNKAIELMNKGDPAKTKRVTDIIDKLDATFSGRERAEYVPAIVGAYPVVPDFLHGMPECMRAKTMVESELAPIRLFVGINVNCTVDAIKAEIRGAASAALAMQLARVRPVELYAFTECHATKTSYKEIIFIVPISTAPVIDKDIAFAFSSIEFSRRFCLSALQTVYDEIDLDRDPMPFMFSNKIRCGTPEYEAAIREALGANPQDLVLLGTKLSEVKEMAQDPVAWVSKQLDAQREVIVD